MFSAANDINLEQDGVQVEVQADGAFQLVEVPVGRWDLHAGLGGYLEAWIPGLEVFSAQTVEGAQPASPGSPGTRVILDLSASMAVLPCRRAS